MRVSFEALCNELANTAGGFTLWVGAGASIAVTRGATPGWTKLVSDVRGAYPAEFTGSAGPKPTKKRSALRYARNDMPEQLEYVASRIGHAAFRQELRKRLVDPIEARTIDVDVFTAQATIGARSSAIVSFNIELLTPLAFVSARDGTSLIPRTFREHRPMGLESTFTTSPGATSPPIYFPHGLLELGNLVMTKSEYDKHRGSVAVTTAVHLCLGGDLVIMGMSLADAYLRAALLKNRRWIHRIFWMGVECDHEEWARVAGVTYVQVTHDRMWKELADAFIAHDTSGELRRRADHLRTEIPAELEKTVLASRERPVSLELHARRLLAQRPALPAPKITEFAEFCVDLGYDVPASILNDPRCQL